ncbi:TetR/AcrR family transcriptional regulator [Aquidulcibacter sp.]|uniref:TetR/AcrR family transcriptional regulator n=1 Tax=Aquidulcibacter sp. TaxID=2052990 RepID=UPI00262258ED|nr:TetR/AcrR family transcriptional regulator [Aquidulcibacter sp.]MCE2892244.1 TetR/AcrR family transcriptional regulator [Hyphomonadaceae bacterium]
MATQAKLLEAAEAEFGERGYHDGSIVEITRRAGVGLGTFYVYFESKEAVFRALVTHMGHETRAYIARQVEQAPDRLSAERIGMRAFFEFARSHRNLYKIVMESQFVAEDSYRAYYDTFAEGYRRNLQTAVERGEIRPGDADIRAWSLIGLSVFLGMRYAIWDETADLEPVVDAALDMIERGLSLGPKP